MSKNNDVFSSITFPGIELNSSLIFKGSVCFEKELEYINAKNGDVYYVLDSPNGCFLYADNKWEPIGDTSTDINQPKELVDMKCSCCGAPLIKADSTHRYCEYCGSIFELK